MTLTAAPAALPLFAARRPPTWLPPLALALLTVVAYLPALHATWIWDDDFYVTNNQTLRSLPGLASIWLDPDSIPQYYPVTHSSFWLEYHLWGLRPLGYHLDNILLQAANACLLWRLLARLGLPAPWLAGALFAVHPVHVESVAWVTERKNVLSGFFYLLATTAYLGRDPAAPPRPSRYALAFLCFAAALLSKSVTSSWPAAVLLLVYYRRGRIGWRDVLPLLPFFVAGAAMGAVTSHVEKFHVGATGTEWDFTLVDRLLIAAHALCFYAAKLAVPWPLVFVYRRWPVPAPPADWLYVAAVAAVFASLWLARRRLGRGPLVAALFFAGTLFPALGFFDLWPQRFSFVADHFQYLASIGPLTLAARALARYRPLAVGVLALLAGLTFHAALPYRDAETLWSDTLAKNPDAWLAHNNLGLILMNRGQLDDAEPHFLRAQALYPTSPDATRNLALLYQSRRNFPAAADQFRRVVDLLDADVAWSYATAARLAATGHTRQAAWYRHAGDRRAHDRAAARAELATVLFKLNRFRDAELTLVAAADLDPDNADVLNTLGAVWAKQNRPAEAMSAFRRAAAANPNSPEPYNNLGLLLAAQGRTAEAMGAFQKALQLKPDYAPARHNLATLQPPTTAP